MPRLPRGSSTRDRLLAYSEVNDSGCRVWLRTINRGGYGMIDVASKTRTVHRVAYEVFVGPIPDGMTVDHMCFETTCINPEHLQLLTMSENASRTRKALSRFCQRGHEFTEENTIWQKNNRNCGSPRHRLCRECSERRNKRSPEPAQTPARAA